MGLSAMVIRCHSRSPSVSLVRFVSPCSCGVCEISGANGFFDAFPAHRARHTYSRPKGVRSVKTKNPGQTGLQLDFKRTLFGFQNCYFAFHTPCSIIPPCDYSGGESPGDRRCRDCAAKECPFINSGVVSVRHSHENRNPMFPRSCGCHRIGVRGGSSSPA